MSVTATAQQSASATVPSGVPLPLQNGTNGGNQSGGQMNATPQPPSTIPYASTSLYVGDLAPDVTEAVLFEIFNAVGPVASVRVCRDATTRRSLGYAYVNFHLPQDAERALDTMNFKNIRNKPCRIMWSQRDPALRRANTGNIFVNHLNKSIDNKQLYDAFSMFGNILSCKVATDADNKQSLGYGFVHFESEDAAKAAIEKKSGTELFGQKIEVAMFKPKKERDATNQYKFTNVFVKNLPPETTKEELDKLFEKYGTITSAVITKSTAAVVGGKGDESASAFGFVNFAAPEQAIAAVEGLNDNEYQGRKLFVGRAQKKSEREKELREKFEAMKAERAKKYAGVNLYIKNLPEEWTDEKLTAEFSKFGQITSARVMKDGNNKSRGFGFVCYTTPEESNRAVTEMNGRMENDKPLYVALAQRKDARRIQLEAQYAARMKLGAPQQQLGGGGTGALPFPQHQMMFPGALGMQRGMSGFMYGPAAAAQQNMRFGMGQQPTPLQGALGRNQGNVGQQPSQGQFGMPINYSLMPVGVGGGLNRGQPGLMGPNQLPQGGNQLHGGRVPPQQGGPNGNLAAQQQNAMRQGQGMMGNQMGRPGIQQQQPGGIGGRPQQMGGPMGGMIGAGMLPTQPLQKGIPSPQQMMGAQQQQQNIRYSDNVRNRAAQPQQPMGMLQQPLSMHQEPLSQIQMPAPNEPLTIKALAAAPEEMRKQMIGERLFPLIKLQEPNLAGKITGMLLEMDNGELIHLLESQPALNEKIQEALAVLHNHPLNEEHQGEQETEK